MKFLLGALAHNIHVQNMALALHEAGALASFYTGFVDNYRSAWARTCRRFVKRIFPELDHRLANRRVGLLPDEIVHKEWFWDALGVAIPGSAADGRIQDILWDMARHGLDGKCADLINDPRLGAFIGVECGCIASIRASKAAGKKSIAAFISPHHGFRKRWVDVEFERFPELTSPYTKRLLKMYGYRDAQCDDEARLADFIYANSKLTADSLISAGFPAGKILKIPNGITAIAPEDRIALDFTPSPAVFLYAGPVSARKGAHYLLMAWKKLRPGRSAKLLLYGAMSLPRKYVETFVDDAVFHGSVPRSKLSTAYLGASALVFPTLCDGFGEVIGEAMAHGLPVITTRNAGAAEFIEDGVNGFLVPARDASALAEKMEWCIRHPQRLLEMRRAALESARRWTWEEFRALFRKRVGTALNAEGLI